MDLELLPPVILFHIVDQLKSPFDLINLSKTSSFWFHLVHQHCHKLWTNIAFDWCDGLWAYLPKLSVSSGRSVEWFVTLLNVLADVKPSTINYCDLFIGDDNHEIWKRCESRPFRCMMSMWTLTFSEHHHKHLNHPAVLNYNFVYDMALYQRQKPSHLVQDTDVLQNVLKILKHEENVEKLAEIGKAAAYDPRNRKRREISYSAYVKCVCTSHDFNNFFEDDVNEGIYHGSPPLPCPYVQPVTAVEEMLLILVTTVGRLVAAELRQICIKKVVSLDRVASLIRDVCQVFRSIHSLLWDNRRLDGHFLLLKSIIEPDQLQDAENFQGIARFKFEKLQESLYEKYSDLPINLNVSKIASATLHIMDSLILNQEIHLLREKWLYPVLFDVRKSMHSDGEEIVRINLTDSVMIGGDNTHQQMVSVAYISLNEVLVVWQLIGPPLY
ncbi:Uncharacterised protein g5836 [Pycnogonum litorale]